jgi:adenylate cyclase
MHVLLRGGLLQRLRLASGLVLFTFAGAHFLNHATGLVSLELMHQFQGLRTAVTRSTAGSVVLGAALVTHMSLGLYKLAMRRTLRLPFWEAAQIAVALCIPFLLLPHIVNTRIAHVFFGVNDTYLYELARLWPDRAVLQSLLLLLVWTHGCIGLHYWLRLTDSYDKLRPVLWTVAALVPLLAIGGFASSGMLTGSIMSDPESLTQLKERSAWPNAADSATMAWMRDATQYAFGALLVVLGCVLLWRTASRRSARVLQITYRDGPTVNAAWGMTLLEASRAAGVPHASVCGGRARCSTCRVKIESGLENLPRPHAAEAVALQALEAPSNVRLACQLRPTASMSVTVLNRPTVPGPVQVEFAEIRDFIASHSRAVLSGEAVDIVGDDASALSHWFADKVSYPVIIPPVADRQFALHGGRVDYLNGQPVAVAALIFGERWISLFAVPQGDAEAVRGTRNGYSVVGWESADLAWFAVADLPSAVLEELQDAVRATEPLAGGVISMRDEARH